MISRYIVFQYLPDPLNDERINFGVATADADGQVIRTRFLSNWARVKSFGGVDPKFLRDFAAEVERAGTPSLFTSTDEEIKALFEQAPRSWINLIQVTTPRASTKAPEDLLNDVARRFLRARVAPRRRIPRSKKWVRAVAYEMVVNALNVAGVPNAEAFVHRTAQVEGDVETHDFDLTVGNGHLATAALTLSFERQNRYDLHRDYSAAAWALEDVRKRSPELDLAVVMLPPVRSSKIYDQARHVFERLDARPVPEDDIDNWADEVAASVMSTAR